jgi:NADPH:quinone reductase-like Zn-dependent oxidoreductase
MKALRFERTGDLANLTLVEVPTPAPRQDEVLVRVKAAGLNRSDVSNVMGGHPYTTLPRTPGRDFSGIVERGPAALLGKAVWGSGKEIGFTRDGSHAEWVLLPADGVALKPERLTFEEAASSGVPYVTAWHALESVQSGARLLVIGAAGAVGAAAIHLARMRGLEVTGAVRSSELLQGGAVQGEWDAIFDTTGHWLTPAIGALARFGRAIVIVSPGDGRPQLPIRDLYRRGASIVGVNSLLYSARDCARLFSELKPSFDSGALRPPDGLVTRPLADGAQTYAALQRGQKGKLVIVP